MPRDSRSRSVRRSRPYERRRSGRESSRPRRSPRERSSAGHTPRFEAPSGWNETSTHWDTRTEYGLNFPKRVDWSVKLNSGNGVILYYIAVQQSLLHYQWEEYL